MTYIIAEPCIGTKDTACVDVCPVDCIHPRKDEGEFEAQHSCTSIPTNALTVAPASRPVPLRPSSLKRKCRRNGRALSS